jgi:hypothetical protein
MGRKIIIDGLCPSDIIFFWHHAIIWDLVLSSKVMTMCNESINSDGKQFHPYQQIKVITKLPNSEQSYKGKVKTHNYINRQNQSTTGKL